MRKVKEGRKEGRIYIYIDTDKVQGRKEGRQAGKIYIYIYIYYI